MNVLKSLIAEILREDLQGFVNDVSKIRYYSGSTVAASLDPAALAKSKEVKRAWKKNADHVFMQSLVKIHWFAPTGSTLQKLKWFLNNQGKDEVSTTAFLPDEKLITMWGQLGIQLEGRVTLAANDMNDVVSGYSTDWMDVPGGTKKFASSGVPRRAGIFNHKIAKHYVLNSDSFDSNSIENEFILDNWKVKAVVITNDSSLCEELEQIIDIAENAKIPLINQYCEKIDYDFVRFNML